MRSNRMWEGALGIGCRYSPVNALQIALLWPSLFLLTQNTLDTDMKPERPAALGKSAKQGGQIVPSDGLHIERDRGSSGRIMEVLPLQFSRTGRVIAHEKLASQFILSPRLTPGLLLGSERGDF